MAHMKIIMYRDPPRDIGVTVTEHHVEYLELVVLGVRRVSRSSTELQKSARVAVFDDVRCFNGYLEVRPNFESLHV
jgi:hypothetical protein